VHEGKIALIRILSGLLFMALACAAAAQKDAAEKAQEGNVDNWIEYYKKQRQAKPPEAAAAQGSAAEAEREKVKGESKGVTR
jgi:hypothetical protein